MLIMASKRSECESMWAVLPQLACLWWPARFAAKKPPSLYNTKFNLAALAFFEARKLLLQMLVLEHNLNVLHLDADSVWFANPYPIFKGVYPDYSLIAQKDGGFVNAGIFYVQNVGRGDATA